jgi:glycosyltransferase involved in cell wall biosynthesis
MNAPIVSVIIPAFNAAPFVGRAVRSVLSQTHRALDLIVVDDGSTDDTTKVLRGFGDQIRWFAQANRGPAAARNLGLAHARGEVVMFLDADDWILPHKLERQLPLVREHAAAHWTYCDIEYVNEKGGPVGLASERFGYTTRPALGGWLFPQLIHGNFIPVHAPLIRRACVDAVGVFDEDPDMVGLEDWEFLLRLADRFEASYAPDVLGGCLVRSGSLSADPAARDRRRFALLDRARVRFAGQIRALGPAGRRLVADTHNWYGYQLVRQRKWPGASRRLWNSVRAWPVQRTAWVMLFQCLAARLASVRARPEGE